MTLSTLLILSFAGAVLSWPVARASGRAAGWVLAALPALLFFAFLRHSEEIIGAGEVLERVTWVPSLGVEFALRLDGFSLLFALLITGIGALVTIYAGTYLAAKSAKDRSRFLVLILLFMSAMLGTVLADNLIMMFVFWELTSLTSFMLIGFDSVRAEARRAALQSLLVTGGGGLALFAGILLLGSVTGSFSLADATDQATAVASSPLAAPIVILILLGAFTKSAQFPFHFWLPNAMQAPTPASAYLHSATMVKLGIYLLARFDLVFADIPGFSSALMLVGSATMLIASIGALRAPAIKEVLAYSTVASLGLLTLLIGLDGPVAAVAIVGFILAHACYKAALFFSAGNIIHAAGTGRLRDLGGLAPLLPWTAASAVLAGLSMAGFPPFMGFIAKEFLFEAQLENAGQVALVAIAVTVNAVMVCVAAVVTIRPFFQRSRRAVTAEHGESPGLFVGPALLAAAGLAIGVLPGGITRVLINPAASALSGTQMDISIGLWHGLTPMLALSALVLLLGTLLAMRWRRTHHWLRRNRSLGGVLGDAGYDAVLRWVLSFADRSARAFRSADPRRHTMVVVAATVGILIYGLVRSGVSLEIRSVGGIETAPALVLVLAVVGAVASTMTRSLLAAVVAVGIVGFASALLFMLNGAPDLALTQFGIETLFVVAVMAVLLRLPLAPIPTRSSRERSLDAGLAVGLGCVIFTALAAMSSLPLDMRLSEYFASASLPEAFGRNVVNVVIVDFRGFDTVGETAVVMFAMIAVWSLLRGRTAASSK